MLVSLKRQKKATQKDPERQQKNLKNLPEKSKPNESAFFYYLLPFAVVHVS
jgi:hypothetical protein